MIPMSIVAGIAISLGCIVNLTVGGYLGAFLFSCGLLTVLYLQGNLFTGQAGLVVQRRKKISHLLLVLLGNTIGTAGTAWLLKLAFSFNENIYQKSYEIAEKRIQTGVLGNLVLSIFCGILMYIAVTAFNRNFIMAILPVMVFVLCGFEHCIADAFYYTASNFHGAYMFFVTVIGNFIGCSLIPLFEIWGRGSKTHKNKENNATCPSNN